LIVRKRGAMPTGDFLDRLPRETEERGRVFIPQEPMKRDPVTQCMVSVMNFNHARRFGEPVVLCPTGPAALSTAPTTWSLKDKLRDFCDDDYLIAVGDPTLQAMAACVACDVNRGRINFLKWDRECGAYIVVKFDLHPRLGKED
jgi:hypothetical protein